jgi:dienelactone hydrolase
MSKNLLNFIAILFLVSSCANQDNDNIPKIDQSLIKVDDLIWDLDALQKKPEFVYLDSTSKVREILFKGIDYKDKETTVFAYYSNPDILKTGKSQGNKFPGVVLISGGAQGAMSEWVELWAKEGYAAITCDYGNTQFSENSGPIAKTLEERLDGIYNAIKYGPKAVRAYRTSSTAILAHSLLLSFPEVEKNKTAVTGISWGGFQTCIVSAIDNRFKAAVPVYGCAFHDEIIFKKHFDKMTISEKELWMSKIDPKNYLSFSQCPTLFINGNNDGCFDIEPFDKTTKLIPEKNRFLRITPNMGHDHPIGWRPKEIAAFFNSIFNNGIPLPKITHIEKRNTSIYYEYNSQRSIQKADFYYSNDTININEKRIWKLISANIYQDSIVNQYPNEEFVFGFLYISDDKNLSVSSELITN